MLCNILSCNYWNLSRWNAFFFFCTSVSQRAPWWFIKSWMAFRENSQEACQMSLAADFTVMCMKMWTATAAVWTPWLDVTSHCRPFWAWWAQSILKILCGQRSLRDGFISNRNCNMFWWIRSYYWILTSYNCSAPYWTTFCLEKWQMYMFSEGMDSKQTVLCRNGN